MTTIFLRLHHPHEVLYFVDHTAHRRGVFQGAPPVPLVEPQSLERRLLVGGPADWATGLHHGDRLLGFSGSPGHHAPSRASASRRPRISATFLPRRAATARGLVT